MLSLGGVYAPSTNNKQTKLPIALQNMTHNQTQINTIALHLDNDYAGRSATRSISEQLGNKYIVRDETETQKTNGTITTSENDCLC